MALASHCVPIFNDAECLTQIKTSGPNTRASFSPEHGTIFTPHFAPPSTPPLQSPFRRRKTPSTRRFARGAFEMGSALFFIACCLFLPLSLSPFNALQLYFALVGRGDPCWWARLSPAWKASSSTASHRRLPRIFLESSPATLSSPSAKASNVCVCMCVVCFAV